MYLTLIVLPLLGSIASGFFGRKVGVSGSHFITSSCVIITTILSFVAFIEVGFNNIPVSIHLFKWVDSESLNVLWGFNFDSLTVSMLIPVLVVSSLVHLYSIEYMSHDPHNQRFFSYLSLFTFMMIILVTANNFLLMFVGWEGVGVCSYLLVSFWFTRIAANQSSLAAFLTNRVGDCLLTVGMFAILWSFGNIDYSTVFSISPFVNENLITLIGICLLIGAMAKSSQVGLHIWLPMAMEGPTPVSALIHAATMVTAGVYLLMRSSPLLEYSSTVLICCLWLGAITTVFSSLIGLFQQDIKKVIAYSTMSQLGMMVIAIGLSSYNLALFHLVNHAFYKALLFLGAGAVIHAVSDNQDFRKYGALRQLLPLTYSVMLIASLSLVAFPFMTGFYSKDFILESAYGQFTFSGITVYFIASIGAMFTTLYSIKVLYLTFLSNPLGPITNYKNAHEGKQYMSLPLIILAIFSIFFGYLTKDIFIGLGSSFFSDNSIFIHPNNEIMLDTEFAVPLIYKILPLFFTILLSIISLVLSEIIPKWLLSFKFSNLGYYIFGFFNQRFLIELLYNKYITNLIFKLGGQTTKVLDKGSVELVGPFGLENVILNLSKNLTKFDTGVVTTYALYILIGLIFYILIVHIRLLSLNIFILLLLALFITINNNQHLTKYNKHNLLPSSLIPNKNESDDYINYDADREDSGPEEDTQNQSLSRAPSRASSPVEKPVEKEFGGPVNDQLKKDVLDFEKELKELKDFLDKKVSSKVSPTEARQNEDESSSSKLSEEKQVESESSSSKLPEDNYGNLRNERLSTVRGGNCASEAETEDLWAARIQHYNDVVSLKRDVKEGMADLDRSYELRAAIKESVSNNKSIDDEVIENAEILLHKSRAALTKIAEDYDMNPRWQDAGGRGSVSYKDLGKVAVKTNKKRLDTLEEIQYESSKVHNDMMEDLANRGYTQDSNGNNISRIDPPGPYFTANSDVEDSDSTPRANSPAPESKSTEIDYNRQNFTKNRNEYEDNLNED